MKKFLLLTCVAMTVSATPVLAQDATDDPFTGVRVEGLAGYDHIGIGIDEDVFGVEMDDSRSGLVYGAVVGYDVSLGSVVVGGEVEYTDSTVKDSLTLNNEDIEGYIVDGTASLKASKDLYFGIRAGSRITPSTLLYWKGGYTMADADFNATGTIDGEAGTIDLGAQFDGFRLGAGVETMVGRNAFAKIEYRYSNYGGGEVDYDGTEVDIDEAFESFDLERHQVVLGFGVRF